MRSRSRTADFGLGTGQETDARPRLLSHRDTQPMFGNKIMARTCRMPMLEESLPPVEVVSSCEDGGNP